MLHCLQQWPVDLSGDSIRYHGYDILNGTPRGLSGVPEQLHSLRFIARSQLDKSLEPLQPLKRATRPPPLVGFPKACSLTDSALTRHLQGYKCEQRRKGSGFYIVYDPISLYMTLLPVPSRILHRLILLGIAVLSYLAAVA
ncbi:hypothetical protein N7533_001442 [Penicillium manginii]|uniref:uncharacterized protein n=1 Tax=Penicillium manginii TaxID=203109 RepID=UPI002549420F|nr:uncharacterized protein N7533_001442 [Penicillium manginii]KAJ5762761.1 hypothetical protein N7533_001442 [Penicillium manginii]